MLLIIRKGIQIILSVFFSYQEEAASKWGRIDIVHLSQ